MYLRVAGHKAVLATVTFTCALVSFSQFSHAKRKHPEKWYQQRWCELRNGLMEVVLPDGTRCDCVTKTHAVEFEFGNNWPEAIGQSAYYSIQTKKKAGIVLILENITDRKYWIRLNTAIKHFNLPIDTWIIKKESN
jgi:hypothetical protein